MDTLLIIAFIGIFLAIGLLFGMLLPQRKKHNIRLSVELEKLPPQLFFDKLYEQYNCTEQYFYKKALTLGIDVLMKKLWKSVKMQEPYWKDIDTIDDELFHIDASETDENPIEKKTSDVEGSVSSPTTIDGGDDGTLIEDDEGSDAKGDVSMGGQRQQSKAITVEQLEEINDSSTKEKVTSNVPRGFFRVLRYAHISRIRIPSTSGRSLQYKGYICWKIDYIHSQKKIFIVFSKELKQGWRFINIDEGKMITPKSYSHYSFGNEETIKRLERLMCTSLAHCQLLQIVNYEVKKDGTLWLQIKKGVIYK